MKAHNKVATKYSHVFRKDGFMALREARNGQTSLVKLAKLLNIKEGTLGHVFGRSYKDTANWRNILRVADLLSVPRAEFVKYHWVEALPPEMEAYEIPDVKLKRKYTKKSEVCVKVASSPKVGDMVMIPNLVADPILKPLPKHMNQWAVDAIKGITGIKEIVVTTDTAVITLTQRDLTSAG